MNQIQKNRPEESRVKEFPKAVEKCEKTYRDVLKYKLDLERANRELERVNMALLVLARGINKKGDDLEDRIASYIGSNIIPLVEHMYSDNISDHLRAKLQVLVADLKNLTPTVSSCQEIASKVSPTELRIANLIHKNYKTAEIARFLKLSPHTVKTHRRSIRKKLSIQNTKVNLTTFLRVKLAAD